jgi:ribonuclease BN (tRNA processing enzyme)
VDVKSTGDGDIQRPTRRDFLAAVAVLGLAGIAPLPAGAQTARTRLILLGTAGGPRPGRLRRAPAQVIVADGMPYVVDCGNGVAWQLVRAGIQLTDLRRVFITHHHSDHNADYGNLILLAWAAGLRTPVDTYGPPPIEKITRLFFEMNQYDIETRIKDEGRVPLVPLVTVHEFSAAGPVLDDGIVKVTAALVDHPPVEPAFAYRFDAADRSIVISGDTAPCDRLVALARGADVLVHEALYLPALDRLLARVPNASRLREHILASHTTVEDAAKTAAAADVKTLVLSHLVPSDDPTVTDTMLLAAAQQHFAGRIVVGQDLLEI